MVKTSYVFFASTAAALLALSACQPPVEAAASDALDEVPANGIAHVHGKAELAVIIEGDHLSMTFDSPLTNLIDFELEPTTEADWARIDALQDKFLRDDALIRLPARVKCVIISISSGLRFRDGHGSLMVEQNFACKKIRRLKSAAVTVFSQFQNLEHLDVFVSGDSPRTSAVMSADQADLALEF
ncbi:MAG: DUF2796 domain-containing protein [Henriciella sp.]|nr:DUF2796 domain-containing protein [Henriciella sp.]